MKTLLLMRHAKSSWSDSSLADHDRPLNHRGKVDAPRMGALLNQHDLIPDIILSSTARRAQDTAKGLLENINFEGEISYHRSIYHGDYSTFIQLLSELSERIHRAMIVGHNPNMDDFLDLICGVNEHMSTASIAVIQFDINAWADLTDETEGGLIHFWKPREVEI